MGVTKYLTTNLNTLMVLADNLSDNLTVEMEFVPSMLSKNKNLSAGLYINVGQDHCYFFDPLTRMMCLPDQAYKPGSWGYTDGKAYDSWPGNKSHDGKRKGVAANIYATNLEPVFQTFRMGLSGYQFDAPKGEYMVGLYFDEPFTNDEMKNIQRTGSSENFDRIFNVIINNELVIDKLNLAAEFGHQTAVKKTFKITTNEGINIFLQALAGKPILSGVAIKKL